MDTKEGSGGKMSWEIGIDKYTLLYKMGFPGGSVVKNPLANAGDTGVAGSGKSLEEEMATHSSILAWKIPWAEKPGKLQSMGSQRIGCD